MLPLKREAYEAIEARYRCAHTTRQLRRRRIAGGRHTFYRQCVRCGHADQAVARAAAMQECTDLESLPGFDASRDSRWRACKDYEYKLAYSEIQPLLASEYANYLKSAEWRTRREAALARDGRACFLCSSTSSLEVHHLTYARIGNELPDDLVVLCHACHAGVHGHAGKLAPQ